MTNHGFGLGTGSQPDEVEKAIKKLKKLALKETNLNISNIQWIKKMYGVGGDEFQVTFVFGENHPPWEDFAALITNQTGIKNLSLYKIP